MKNKRKKLFSAFVMLLVSVVVTTTASYAWFTENTTLSISQVQVNVAASDGIQISLDAASWKGTLFSADLIAATAAGFGAGKNQIPYSTETTLQVSPVSSAGTVAGGLLQMYKGSVKDDGTGTFKLTAAKETDGHGQSGNYFAFDVYILASNACKITLVGSSVAGGTGGIQNAARVAFINEGSVAAGSAAATAFSLNNGTVAMIWEPNAGSHTAAAVSHAANNYGANIGEGDNTTPTATVASYYALNGVIATAVNLNSTASPMSSVTPTMQTTGATVTKAADYTISSTGVAPNVVINVTKGLAISLAQGINKIRVYAWFEGQDYDCQDLATGLVTFDIKFEKAAV